MSLDLKKLERAIAKVQDTRKKDKDPTWADVLEFLNMLAASTATGPTSDEPNRCAATFPAYEVRCLRLANHGPSIQHLALINVAWK